MKNSRISVVVLMALSCFASACNDVETVSDQGQTQSAIVNGSRVTGTNRYSTVALLYKDSSGEFSAFCTGSLISPNYVLTAGHCVADCGSDSMETYRNSLYIGFGQSENNIVKKIAVKKSDIHAHPNFICTDYDIKNDIAVLKLSTPVSTDFVKPVLLIPPSLIPSDVEVSYMPGVMATSVGFGMTNPANLFSSGTKYETTRLMAGICPLNRINETRVCSEIRDYLESNDIGGFLYFLNEDTFICSGDSGGPTFITRNGVEYQIGIHSWVLQDDHGRCVGFSAMTYVNDYRGFVKQFVSDLPPEIPEKCDNGRDDNGDNKVDCDDPYCYGLEICKGEICYNGIDDNKNGLTDCADPACASSDYCKPEDCTNGEDDNLDGLVDCVDPQCFRAVQCIPEDCTNGIDDNQNNFVDCDDPQCKDAVACLPEDCSNGEDDNENGLTDCADPQCADFSACIPEDCSNGLDDNHNGLIDCNDAQCFLKPICIPEDCSNGEDDNGDNLIDCDDPKCALESHCKVSVEDCTNGEDDNDNDLIDCDDPYCSNHPDCQVKVEVCGNGKDDDNNGLTDCADPACLNTAPCSDTGSTEEICDNGIDDDKNGKTDCDDSACNCSEGTDSMTSLQSSCSALPRNTSSPFALLLMLLGICGCIRLRRQK